VHDADFLACPPSQSISPEGVVTRLYSSLVSQGWLVPQEEGFCRIQVGGWGRRVLYHMNTSQLHYSRCHLLCSHGLLRRCEVATAEAGRLTGKFFPWTG
jgi:hypothetical protein